MKNIINLISGPRNVSTALMYSFAQRMDTIVIDEPFYAYYLLKSNKEHPGREEILNDMSADIMEINKHIENSQKSKHMFIKNMAHHLAHLPSDWSLGKKNIFLIRDPKFVIASYINQIKQPLEEDLGYKTSCEILKNLKVQGENYLVINSKSILLNPAKELSRMCEFANMEFDSAMLSWKKGPIKEDGIWSKYWYKNVHNSTGFAAYHEKSVEIPKRLQALLEECQNFYEILNAESK